jgi:hypothetical protein
MNRESEQAHPPENEDLQHPGPTSEDIYPAEISASQQGSVMLTFIAPPAVHMVTFASIASIAPGDGTQIYEEPNAVEVPVGRDKVPFKEQVLG